MAWQQLTFPSDSAQLESIEALLLGLGALSVTFRDAHDDPVLEPKPGETPLWPQALVSALFETTQDLALVQAALRSALDSALDLHIEILQDRDWERAWMDDFHPMRFGERVWICPSSHEPPQPEAVNILLDPGLAFGTGTHPTTALCLRWLDAHPPQDAQVIDYGCGSGVLAIAALKLGARHAIGIDIDPQALTATRNNAEKNNIEEASLDILLPQALAQAQVELLLANILADPLCELAPQLAAYTRPDGHIVLSGILRHQGEAVRAAYAPWFEMQEAVHAEDWVLLSGRRRHEAA